jgi:hypothetical protein
MSLKNRSQGITHGFMGWALGVSAPTLNSFPMSLALFSPLMRAKR